MQAYVVRKRVGCSEADRKAWERAGVLIPHHAGSGPGIHAQYDDANLVAAAVALRMKRSHVTASRYAAAFVELHHWLRGRSSLEWPRFRVCLTPEQALFQRAGEPLQTAFECFTLDLAPVCASLFEADTAEAPDQLPLPFGLEAVR